MKARIPVKWYTGFLFIGASCWDGLAWRAFFRIEFSECDCRLAVVAKEELYINLEKNICK